jgi:multiple sugar transport system permease protein/sn-glycerol 3-phosphate transport system permease protein
MVSRESLVAATRPAAHPRTRTKLAMPRIPIALHVVVIAVCIFSAFPLLWMLSTAFKGTSEMFTSSPRFFPHHPTLDNFSAATDSKPVLRWFFNTAIFAALTTALRLLLIIPASYALARLEFPLKKFVLLAIIGTMIIPSVVTLVPNYLLIVDLGWINSMQGLVVPTVSGSAFFLFLLRQHMLQIPNDILDAASIDGAGTWRMVWTMAAPMVMPGIWAVTTLSFLWSWNSYLWPLLVSPGIDSQTIAVGLGTYASDPDSAQLWGGLMVVALLSSLPPLLIYLFAQKQLTSALTSGLKG